MTTCSPQRPVPYPLPNPILVAFNHQLDFSDFRAAIQKEDSTSLSTVDGGLVLFSDAMGGICRFWINDSLLVFQVDATASLPLSGVGDRAIFEAQTRQRNANLAEEIRELLTSDFVFGTSRSNIDYSNSPVTSNGRSIQIQKEQIQLVDSLTWHSSAFDKEASYRFKEGCLHGQFTTVDSLDLFQKGRFQDGAEFGIWEYRDSSGKLQYTEEYALGGELQKVILEKGATFTREEPLPTLKYLWRIHWVMFGLFCLLEGYLLFRYFQSLRGFMRPYQEQSSQYILVLVFLVSPVLAFIVGFVTLFSIMIMSNGMAPILGWDLPLDFLAILQGLLIFPIIECLWFCVSNRFQDALWHTAIVILATLIWGEWHFLTQLEQLLATL